MSRHPNEEALKGFISYSRPALQAVLDGICVLDCQHRVVYCNLAMKSLFGLSARALAQKPDFCSLIELSGCRHDRGKCCLNPVLEKGEELVFAETPAVRDGEKVRISLHAVPVLSVGRDTETPLSAVVSLRDTTGEVLLQAKYHKLLELLEHKDEQLETVSTKLAELRERLVRARR